MTLNTENPREAHDERLPVAGEADLPVRADLGDLSCVAVLHGSPTMTVDAFVKRFGECKAQTRSRGASQCYDDAGETVREIYARARAEAHAWSPDAELQTYLFHDNLTKKGSHQEFNALFDEHQPPEEIIDLSEQLPCGGLLVTLGGPDTFTGMHSHGPAYCMLLAGTKEWWIWPPDVDHLLRWVARGAVTKNPLAYWEVYVQPALERGVGILERLDALERSGLFKPPGPSHRSAQLIERMRAGEEPVPACHRFRALRVVQRAGQGIYVPERFGHAVRNGHWPLALIYQLEPAGEHY